MKYFRKVPSTLLATLIGVGLMFAQSFGPGSAAFAQNQICGNYGTGYCMNDWNNGGLGNQIKMFNGGASNENFYMIPVDPCHDSGLVSQSLECPFTNHQLNAQLNNMPIFEFQYGGNGDCIGTDSNNYGILTSCGDQYGNGAGNGAFNVEQLSGGVPTGLMVNRYWSNVYGGALYVCSSGSLRGVLDMGFYNPGTYGGCRWGGM